MKQTVFVIKRLTFNMYLKTVERNDWAPNVSDAYNFSEYGVAEKYIEKLPIGYYQVEKIFKVL